METIFYATDLHGSETCFKKFLKAGTFYHANILFLGGDYGPKELILFSQSRDTVDTLDGQGHRQLLTPHDFERYSKKCRISGHLLRNVDADFLKQVTPNLYRSLFADSVKLLLQHWAELAQAAFRRDGIPIYVVPGNDDPPETDKCLSESPFHFIDRKVVSLSENVTVLGWGGSNITPWSTPREYDEADILSSLQNTLRESPITSPTILFAHPPPSRSGLDLAPKISAMFSYDLSLGSSNMIPVGSTAIRQFIEDHQPQLGLFGHVHEARGHQLIGRTICINPGSAFYSGQLLGCILRFRDGKLNEFQFTEG